MFSNRPASWGLCGFRNAEMEGYHQPMPWQLFNRFLLKTRGVAARDAGNESGLDSQDPNDPFPEVVQVPFADVLDLHSIPPKHVRAVVEGYLEEANERGVRYLRIIHGRGIGVQREIVRSILQKNEFVSTFSDAPPEAGGWGATVITLRPAPGPPAEEL